VSLDRHEERGGEEYEKGKVQKERTNRYRKNTMKERGYAGRKF
jgi:hypothetical protein